MSVRELPRTAQITRSVSSFSTSNRFFFRLRTGNTPILRPVPRSSSSRFLHRNESALHSRSDTATGLPFRSECESCAILLPMNSSTLLFFAVYPNSPEAIAERSAGCTDSQDSYACNHSAKYPRKCTMHYIKTSTLNMLALDAIRAVSGFVKEGEAEFVRLVQEQSDIQRAIRTMLF